MHCPRKSATVGLRLRCCLVGVCAALLLALLNALPLIELNLQTNTPANMWSASPEGSLDDVYANGHSLQQELQVQTTPAAELDTGSCSEIHRGCSKRIISGSAIPNHVLSLDPVLMASDNEGPDMFVKTVCPA